MEMKCNYCGYEWITKKANIIPKVCAKCKNYNYQGKRKRINIKNNEPTIRELKTIDNKQEIKSKELDWY